MVKKLHLKLKPSFFGEGFVSIESIFLGIYNIYIGYTIFSGNGDLPEYYKYYHIIFVTFQLLLILYCIIGGYKFYRDKKRLLYYNSLFLMIYVTLRFFEFIFIIFHSDNYPSLISSDFRGLYVFIGIISGCLLIINGLFMLKSVKSEYYEKASKVSLFLILTSFILLFLVFYNLYVTFPYKDLIFNFMLLISTIFLFIGVPIILYSTLYLLIHKLRRK